MNKEILLFNTKSILLYRITSVRKDGTIDFQKLFETEWNNENLEQKITKIKTENKLKKVSILISDELSYLASLEVKKSSIVKNERASIASKISNVFPENIDSLVWDYKLIKTHRDLNIYQIVAVNKSFLNLLKKAIANVGIEVDFIEPVAYSLAQITKDEEDIHVLFYSGEFGNIYSLVYKGAVIFSTEYNLDTDPKEKFNTFKDYVRKKYELGENIKIISNLKLEEKAILKGNLNPLAGIVSTKRTLKGKDRDLLNIPIKTNKKEEKKADLEKIDLKVKESEADSVWDNNNDDEDVDEDSTSGKKKLFLMIGVLIVLIVLAGLLIVIKKKDKSSIINNDKIKVVEESTKEAVVVPDELNAPDESTPEVELNVNFSDYKILVENGAGIAGEASKVKKILEDAGFENIAVGNADSYNYTKTEIIFKENIPEKIFNATKNAILNNYQVKFPIKTIEKDRDYDVIVTVGSLKK